LHTFVLFLQLQNFNDAEYKLLCDHLGHTLEVHNRWYRLRSSTAELVKVGKILKDDFNLKTADHDEAALYER